jgi:hypothetical protein
MYTGARSTNRSTALRVRRVDFAAERSHDAWRPEGLRGRCLRAQPRLSVGRVHGHCRGSPWGGAAVRELPSDTPRQRI